MSRHVSIEVLGQPELLELRSRVEDISVHAQVFRELVGTRLTVKLAPSTLPGEVSCSRCCSLTRPNAPSTYELKIALRGILRPNFAFVVARDVGDVLGIGERKGRVMLQFAIGLPPVRVGRANLFPMLAVLAAHYTCAVIGSEDLLGNRAARRRLFAGFINSQIPYAHGF